MEEERRIEDYSSRNFSTRGTEIQTLPGVEDQYQVEFKTGKAYLTMGELEELDHHTFDEPTNVEGDFWTNVGSDGEMKIFRREAGQTVEYDIAIVK